jgi:4-hydroxy-3-polyprenylbenzoate decarboxylase
MKMVIGITGASGLQLADYFLKFLEKIKKNYFEELYLVVSDNVKLVANAENYEFSVKKYEKTFKVFKQNDFSAPIASGSFQFDGMIIIPTSMATVGAIASGYGQNLIHRCADVCLKEGKKLILVPRETPLSLIHLENLTKIKKAGGDIVPFIPSFYSKPETIEDLFYFFSIRLLDCMKIHIKDKLRWGEHDKKTN